MVKTKELDRIIAEKKERLKELVCINRTTQILKEGKAMDETLSHIVRLLPLVEGEDATLKKPDISEAEKHGTLKHSASVYDPDNDSIMPELDRYGPRIINFANILKYEYVPLAKAIEIVLEVVKEALGSAVEIEYAVDLNRDKNGKASFHLLQIKPLVGSAEDYHIDMDELDRDKIILFAEKSMGNGKIDHIFSTM